MEANLCRFLYHLFISVLPLEIQLSRGEGWDPIKQFNLVTFLCLSQATGISNIICRGLLLCVQWAMVRSHGSPRSHCSLFCVQWAMVRSHGSPRSHCSLFCVRWAMVRSHGSPRSHCSLCWYWWYCWSLLFRLSFHKLGMLNKSLAINTVTKYIHCDGRQCNQPQQHEQCHCMAEILLRY